MNTSHPVILFDGVCNLCNGFVQFSIKNDPSGKLKYTSLQSEAAKEILASFGKDGNALSTVMLVENGKVYSQSTAALRILRHFGGGFTLLYGLIIIPKPIRDWVYNYIAKNRYKWFGKQESCWLPSPELQNRFL